MFHFHSFQHEDLTLENTGKVRPQFCRGRTKVPPSIYQPGQKFPHNVEGCSAKTNTFVRGNLYSYTNVRYRK